MKIMFRKYLVGITILAVIIIDLSNAQDCNTLFNNEMLRLHNLYRTKHKAPPLKLDNALVSFAKSYASKLATRNGGLVHSQTQGQGENLAAIYGVGDTKKCTGRILCVINFTIPSNYSNFMYKFTFLDLAKQFFLMWYNEKDQYDFSKGQFSLTTGHFTQVVWRSTTKLGCGLSFNGNRAYCCCSYIPPGNVQGQYKDNVKPA